MVCHDGSQASINALNTVYKGMMKDKDHLSVANVWSIEKEEYLKYDLKHQYIKETTEAHCSGIGKRYTWYDHEMQQGDSAKSLLLEMSNIHHADLMVTGYHGRKGPKEDPTVMGTAVQHMSVYATKPICIIKDPHERETRPNGYRYAVCIDGSEQSLKALAFAAKLKSK